MLREEAWIELDLEPPDDAESKLMDDAAFEEEARLASEGRWDELGLDQLPDNWADSSIEDLRNAG